MAKPTKTNITGVESYDHSAVKHMPEHHEVLMALNGLVRAMNEAEAGVGQAEWLKMVEQMAASLSYSDSSGHPSNGCAHEHDGAWPYKTTVKGTSLSGEYRCFYCDAEWRVGHYDVNIAELF